MYKSMKEWYIFSKYTERKPLHRKHMFYHISSENHPVHSKKNVWKKDLKTPDIN